MNLSGYALASRTAASFAPSSSLAAGSASATAATRRNNSARTSGSALGGTDLAAVPDGSATTFHRALSDAQDRQCLRNDRQTLRSTSKRDSTATSRTDDDPAQNNSDTSPDQETTSSTDAASAHGKRATSKATRQSASSRRDAKTHAADDATTSVDETAAPTTSNASTALSAPAQADAAAQDTTDAQVQEEVITEVDDSTAPDATDDSAGAQIATAQSTAVQQTIAAVVTGGGPISHAAAAPCGGQEQASDPSPAQVDGLAQSSHDLPLVRSAEAQQEQADSQETQPGQTTTVDHVHRPHPSPTQVLENSRGGNDATTATTASTPASSTPTHAATPAPGDVAATLSAASTTATGGTHAASTGSDGASTATATGTAASGANGEATAGDINTARIARGLQSALAQRGGTVTLRLQPPELGQIKIQMQVQDGQVQASFTADTDAARGLLTQEMGHLRTALEKQGLTVERLDVQTASVPHQAPTGTPGQYDGADDGRSRGQWSQQPGQQFTGSFGRGGGENGTGTTAPRDDGTGESGRARRDFARQLVDALA